MATAGYIGFMILAEGLDGWAPLVAQLEGLHLQWIKSLGGGRPWAKSAGTGSLLRLWASSFGAYGIDGTRTCETHSCALHHIGGGSLDCELALLFRNAVGHCVCQLGHVRGPLFDRLVTAWHTAAFGHEVGLARSGVAPLEHSLLHVCLRRGHRFNGARSCAICGRAVPAPRTFVVDERGTMQAFARTRTRRARRRRRRARGESSQTPA